jgi:hypothetical protein
MWNPDEWQHSEQWELITALKHTVLVNWQNSAKISDKNRWSFKFLYSTIDEKIYSQKWQISEDYWQHFDWWMELSQLIELRATTLTCMSLTLTALCFHSLTNTFLKNIAIMWLDFTSNTIFHIEYLRIMTELFLTARCCLISP